MDDYQNQYEKQEPNKPVKKQSKGPMKPSIVIVSVICGTIMFLGFWYILFSQFFGNLFGTVNGSNFSEAYAVGDTIDVISVEGTIAKGSATYQHNWTINKVNELMKSNTNKAIFLYVNSPGGGVYESDELYLKLKQYKEETGRPVYAYMADTAASGGLYVSMAADKIFANRMTMTGSIGVVMSLTDTSGLQELIGVKEEKVVSGINKAMGSPLTAEQRDILQSLIDESYEIFVDVVAEGRNLDRNKVYELADGRVYSPKQAKELGLIDEIAGYEEAVDALISEQSLQNCIVYHQSPPTSFLQEILTGVSAHLEGSNALSQFKEVTSYIDNNQSPKLMYYMN